METCDVLGCAERATQVSRLTPPGSALLNARLCYEHHDAVERGDRWLADWTEESPGITRATLLMGAELPPLVRNYTCATGHFSDQGQTQLVVLELMHVDGSTTDVEFELDPAAARSLGIWLEGRNAAPARAGAGSAPLVQHLG